MSRSLRRVAASVLALGLVGLPGVLDGTQAATPQGDTLDHIGDSTAWSGAPQELVIGDNTGLVAENHQCPTPDTAGCDEFRLSVVDPGTPYQVAIAVASDATEDYDLYVYGPDGELADYSGQPNGVEESVTLDNPPAGEYSVRVRAFSTTPGPVYRGSAAMEVGPVPPPPPPPIGTSADETVEPAPGGPFTELAGFATKTGYRGVFTWSASAPVAGSVHLGTSPETLDTVVAAPGAPDTAQMVITDGLEVGATYYWKVVDQLSGEESGVGRFTAVNAYTEWHDDDDPATRDTYEIDMLVQLDTEDLDESASESVPGDLALKELAQGMSVFAERVYDATDGYVRIGDVLVTDTNTDYATNIPFGPQHAVNWDGIGIPRPPCVPGTNLADVLVQTSVPADSHTFEGFAIADPCTSFYVGRMGWLRIPSYAWRGDLDFAGTAAHELSHYALNAPDLYLLNSDADCRNTAWDGSLMHNTTGYSGGRWWMTELDRNQTLTPCEHGTQPWSWDEMRARYQNIPEPVAPEHVIDTRARGNEDGGALQIRILDRQPGSSTLESFVGSDEAGEAIDLACPAGSPVLVDAEGDARQLGEPNEETLDLRAVTPSWDAAKSEVTLDISMTDVRSITEPPAPGGVGEHIVVTFKIGSTLYELTAAQADTQTFTLSAGGGEPTAIAGSFDPESNVIRAVMPAAALGGTGPGSTLTDFSAQAWHNVVLTGALLQDDGPGACSYQVPTPPPPAPTKRNGKPIKDKRS
jgi:hypothetical protein